MFYIYLNSKTEISEIATRNSLDEAISFVNAETSGLELAEGDVYNDLCDFVQYEIFDGPCVIENEDGEDIVKEPVFSTRYYWSKL